jgi:DNA-directed RNA polymerase specialized sigma24 family protein
MTLLQDINQFCPHYYATIHQAFLYHCRNESMADDLTQNFLMDKIVTGGLIPKFLERARREEAEGLPRTSFRNYLFRSIRFAWLSDMRKENRRPIAPTDDPIVNMPAPTETNESLDADTLYAFAVLNRALHNVRNYCRKKGMDAHWSIFEESILARFDDMRTPRTREQLREDFFPLETSNQKLDNALTSVKRMVRRNLEAIFMRDPFEDTREASQFDVWLEILSSSNASLHSALQAALRLPEASASSGSGSEAMIREPDPDEVFEKDLAFAVSFRVTLPIIEWQEWNDPGELMLFLPSGCPFLPNNRRRGMRPLSLAVLMAPTTEEERELMRFKPAEILRLVKDLAKRQAHPASHPADRNMFKLVYTLAVTIARVRFGEAISSHDSDTQQDNVRKYLNKPWVDDDIKSFFRQALKTKGVWYAD